MNMVVMQDLSKPSVPEVSIIFDDSSASRKNDMKVPQSYKEWKQQQNQLELQQAKQFYSSPTLADTSSTAKEKKKNVTFQSPTGDRDLMREPHRRQSQAASPRSDFGTADAHLIHSDNLRAMHAQLNVSPNFDAQPNVLAFANESHSPRSNGLHGTAGPANAVNTGPASSSPRHADDNAATVSLDDIYRLLTNLQLTTQPQSEQPEQMNDLAQQRNLHSPPHRPNRYDHMNIRRMPANANVAAAPEDMPTTRDLFNIVVKQQEQLMNIQKQIHMLLVHTMNGGDAAANARRPQRITDHRESPTMADRHANRPRPVNPIGLMTSLEINVQHCNRNKVIKPSGGQCECNGRPKYGHTSESELSDQDNGRHANGSGAAEGTVNADWMFYGNVLNQVNEVLENTSPSTNRSPIGPQPPMHADQPLALARDTTAATTDTNGNERPNFCSAKVKQFGFQFDDVNISAKAKR